jgi:hypothetical protein
MQRLVDFISIVTNSTLLRNNTRAVTTMERNGDFCWVRPNITTRGSNTGPDLSSDDCAGEDQQLQ